MNHSGDNAESKEAEENQVVASECETPGPLMPCTGRINRRKYQFFWTEDFLQCRYCATYMWIAIIYPIWLRYNAQVTVHDPPYNVWHGMTSSFSFRPRKSLLSTFRTVRYLLKILLLDNHEISIHSPCGRGTARVTSHVITPWLLIHFSCSPI